jgi:hypothetical protein
MLIILLLLAIPLLLGTTTAYAQVQTDPTTDPNVALDMLEEMDQYSIDMGRFITNCTQQASETTDPNILEECTLVMGEFNVAMRDIWALHEPTISKYVEGGQSQGQSQSQSQSPSFEQSQPSDETTTEAEGVQPAEGEGVLTVDTYGTNESSAYYVCGGPMVTIRDLCLSFTGQELTEQVGEFIYPVRDGIELFGCAIDQGTYQYACDRVVTSGDGDSETITLTLRDPSPITIPFDVSEIQVVNETGTDTASNEIAPQLIS